MNSSGIAGLRLLVIGLDGATWEMMRPLMAQGDLPNMRRLMAEGVTGALTSTIPPVTAPAWSGFMTGLNPGKHGIFQWRTYDPTNYTCLDERLMTSERLAGRTFWDLLGQSGHRVGIITVPMTYPVWPVPGYLLAGYPCPDSQRNYAFPPEWGESLTEPMNFDADYYLNASETEIWKQGLEMLERRTSLALDLIQENEVNACVVVLGEIDRAQHDFWQYAHPSFPQYLTASGQRYRDVIADHYRVADAQVGRLLEAISDQTVVIVMSDHGAGPHPPFFWNTNAWLRERGWLTRRESGGTWRRTLGRALSTARKMIPFEERLRRFLPASLVHGARRLSLNIADVEWGETVAYRFPMYHPAEGIEINLRGRQPEGIVEPGAEFEALRDKVIDALRGARDPQTGKPIAEAVHRREELYTGQYTEIAPDIVFLTREGYKANSGLDEVVSPVPLGEMVKYNGLHRMEGILAALGPNMRRGGEISDANILDIAPTILYALGQPIPSEMDGKVLQDLFAAGYVDEHPIRVTEFDGTGQTGDSELSEQDAQEMRDKLRGLGYIS